MPFRWINPQLLHPFNSVLPYNDNYQGNRVKKKSDLLRRLLRDSRGVVLPFVAMIGTVTLIGITYILSNTTQEKNVQFAKADVAAETIITGFFVYADAVLKQRKCIDLDTGGTNADCERDEDWTDEGYTPRLLLDDATAAIVAASKGVAASKVKLDKIEFTLNDSSMFIFMPIPKDKKISFPED